MEESSDHKRAWSLCQKIFPILNDASTQEEDKPFLKNEFEEVCNFMRLNQLQELLQHFVITKVEKRLRDEIVPEFWSYFKKSESDNKGLKQFYNAVKSLYDNYRQLENIVSRLDLFRQATKLTAVPYNEDTVQDCLKLIVKATLFAQLHVDYQVVTMNFYEAALKMEDVDDANADGQCIVCVQESLNCNCLHLFQETNRFGMK